MAEAGRVLGVRRYIDGAMKAADFLLLVHRTAEGTLLRTSRAMAAYEGDEEVTLAHLRRIAPMALRHRLRRNVLDDAGSTTRVERAIAELWGDVVASR